MKKPNNDNSDVRFKSRLTNDVPPFVTYQIYCYILSSICMFLYFLHFVISSFITNDPTSIYLSLEFRIFYHAMIEIIILVLRSINEFYYERWGFGDILHHVAHGLLTYYVLFTDPSLIRRYGWLLCQMQILHFPLVIWYYGCLKKPYSVNIEINKICTFLFPFFWMFAVGYRFSVMFINVYITYISNVSFYISYNSHYLNIIISLASALLVSYLDYGWTKYFIGHHPNHKSLSYTQLFLYFTIGVISGYIVSFTM